MQTSIAVPRYSLCLQDCLSLVCIMHPLLRSMPCCKHYEVCDINIHLPMYAWQCLTLEESIFQNTKQLRDWRASGPQKSSPVHGYHMYCSCHAGAHSGRSS